MTGGVIIVGCGAVGASLGEALKNAGVQIVGVADLDDNRSAGTSLRLGVPNLGSSFWDSLGDGGTVLLAVPDNTIGQVAAEAVKRNAANKDQVWLHVSGRFSYRELAALVGATAGVGSFHPASVFPPGRVTALPAGTVFAVDGVGRGRPRAEDLARALGGRSVFVPDDQRTAYHAALVMVSNYLAALVGEGRRVLRAVGLKDDVGESLLLGLVSSALLRAQDLGVDGSLSGPIRRGDVATVESHRAALEQLGVGADVYRSLGVSTLALMKEIGGREMEESMVAAFRNSEVSGTGEGEKN